MSVDNGTAKLATKCTNRQNLCQKRLKIPKDSPKKDSKMHVSAPAGRVTRKPTNQIAALGAAKTEAQERATTTTTTQ
jgi:hypothetical protein